MVVFNKVRITFQKEVNDLKPLIREAYRSIHRYQRRRTEVNEIKMREAIKSTTAILNLFVDRIPHYKGDYIRLLGRQQNLKPFDLIMCFDRAIYELHLYAVVGKSGKWAESAWSKELLDLLNERQISEPKENKSSRGEIFLSSGKTACNGTARGRACVIPDISELYNIKKGDILITPMTSPDFIVVAHLISGLVTDRGGVVCHAAILAREYNIPCIVGCNNATEVIKHGQMIRLDAVSGIVLGYDDES